MALRMKCRAPVDARTHLPAGQLQAPGIARLSPLRCRPTAALQRKQLVVQASKRVAAAAAAAAAAPAASTAVQLLNPGVAFSTATYTMVPLYFILAFLPRSKVTRMIVNTPILPLAFGIAYAVLAWQAWQSGAVSLVVDAIQKAQPLPCATSLGNMFQDRTLAALAWLHLLLLDFLTARAVLMDGLRQLVPTAHSVLLCFMVGPLGLLSHIITRLIVHKRRGDSPAIASSSMWYD